MVQSGMVVITHKGQKHEFSLTPRLLIRFWGKVNVSPELNRCWEWNACCHPDGYGVLSFNVRRMDSRKWDCLSIKAHRISWQIANGPIPLGMSVLHKCDNRPCVRPDHLYVGTQGDNIRDALHRGAWTPPQKRLTFKQAQEIRLLYKPRDRKLSGRALARRYGVSTATVSLVVNGIIHNTQYPGA